MAHEALSLHIKSMLEAGEKIVAPSKLEDIIDDYFLQLCRTVIPAKAGIDGLVPTPGLLSRYF
jgi:hypothetical protein